MTFKVTQEETEEAKEFYACKWTFEKCDDKPKLGQAQEDLVQALQGKKHSFSVKQAQT